MKQFIILILLILYFSAALAQVTIDSTDFDGDTMNAMYGVSEKGIPFPVFEHDIDTHLSSFHLYNPLTKDNAKLFANLGNIGLAYTSISIIPPLQPEFRLAGDPFGQFLYKQSDVRYYKSMLPYTELIYVMGTNKEQVLNVKLSQYLFTNFTIGLDFRIRNSPGSYAKQESTNSNFFATVTYHTPNERYGFITNFLSNTITVEENGGLLNDSSFTENIETDRKIMTVNLYNAQNYWRDRGVYFKQYLTPILGNKNDSTNKKFNLTAGTFYHSIHIKWNTQAYTDGEPNSGFYENIFSDSIYTNDSISYFFIKNRIGWSSHNPENPGNPDNFLGFGIDFDKHKAWQTDYTSDFFQLSPFVQLRTKVIPYTYLDGSAFWVIGGYNSNDRKLEFELRHRMDEYTGLPVQFGLKAYLSSIQPDWILGNYSSNHFRWENDFKKIGQRSAEVFIDYSGYKLNMSFISIDNYTYFNYEGMPAQVNGSTWLMQWIFRKNFAAGAFRLHNSIIYQSTERPSVVRIPDLIIKESAFFSFHMFKRALFTNIGIDATYYTEYFGLAYMPATRQFIIQDEIKTGNNLFMDFFLSIKIKRARIFVKYKHFNSGWFGYNYFMVPHYPAQDASFRFGVSWKFFD